MSVRDYLRVLRRRGLVILVATLLATAAAVVIAALVTPVYEARTTLRVATAESNGSVNFNDVSYSDRLLNTYGHIASSPTMRGKLAKQLGLRHGPPVGASVTPGTELMTLAIRARDPRVAAGAANALAGLLITDVRQLSKNTGQGAVDLLKAQVDQAQTQLGTARAQYTALAASPALNQGALRVLNTEIQQDETIFGTISDQYQRAQVAEAERADTISVVAPAAVPTSPVRPQKPLYVAAGALLGLIGGLGLAFLFESIDLRFRSPEAIADAAETPILARVPKGPRRDAGIWAGHSAQKEAVRMLRTSLFAFEADAPLRVVGVTSAEPGEGKSSITANLGSAIAETGRSVVLVDADLRRPALHAILGVSNDVGLAEVLEGTVALNAALQDTPVPGLRLLASGATAAAPTDQLGSLAMAAVLRACAARSDIVLVDTPALLVVADSAAIVSLVDAALLVVNQSETREESVREAVARIARLRIRSLGIVVNRTEPSRRAVAVDYYAESGRDRG